MGDLFSWDNNSKFFGRICEIEVLNKWEHEHILKQLDILSKIIDKSKLTEDLKKKLVIGCKHLTMYKVNPTHSDYFLYRFRQAVEENEQELKTLVENSGFKPSDFTKIVDRYLNYKEFEKFIEKTGNKDEKKIKMEEDFDEQV